MPRIAESATLFLCFFFQTTTTAALSTLSLHDALPIWIGRARAGAPDVTRSTSRPAISIGIPRDSSRPAGRGQAARIASRSRPGAARRLGPDEEDDREDVQERRERPREVVASGRVIDRARDERTPAGHRAGQREEESDDRARLAAAEEVADDRGEERGDRAVRVPEDERVAEEQGEAAAGEEEAEEADGLERHRDPDGRLAPDPVRDRAHDETARDGADADGRDDPGAGQRRVPEVARERDAVNERDEDQDQRRRERGA